MTYLIDTCIMSEFVKKIPNPQVSEWFNQQSLEQLFLSIITIAEIKKGIYKIQDSQPKRYQKLKIWLQEVEIEFFSQILPINDDILDNWAKFSAFAELKGRKFAVMDSLIAATAHHYKLTLVTRNVNDFQLTPVKILNPYIPV